MKRWAMKNCSKKKFMDLVAELKQSPIAVNTADANEQHYELPTEFFQYCLGKNLKYSSGYWKPGVKDIDTSEDDMLALTCKRADLQDGQNVLELGCGWGFAFRFTCRQGFLKAPLL